jgi:DNA repair protein RecO
MNCGLFAAELLDAFTQNHDPNRTLFDSFANFLKNIQQSPEESHTLCLLIVFQLTLLRNIGSALQIDNCCNCSAPFDNWPEIYFATRLNGLICPACEQNYTEKIKMSPKCAASLRDTKKLAAACNKTLAEIEKILIFHFTELMGKRPKLAPFFNAK